MKSRFDFISAWPGKLFQKKPEEVLFRREGAKLNKKKLTMAGKTMSLNHREGVKMVENGVANFQMSRSKR